MRHLYTVYDRTSKTVTKVMNSPEVRGQSYDSHKDVYILTRHMTG